MRDHLQWFTFRLRSLQKSFLGSRSNPSIMKHERSSPMVHLPIEIIAEILSRLPLKYLLRYKSVSKLWCAEISDPGFSDNYFSRAAAHPSSSSFLLCSKDQDVFFDIYGSGVIARKIKFPSPPMHPYLTVLGFCKGLLCISSIHSLWSHNDFVYICNPITGESFRLPDSNPYSPRWRWPRIVSSGFGFNPSTNEFKVVLVFHFNSSKWFLNRKVQVYTLGSNSWKTTMHTIDPIDRQIIGYYEYGPGVFHNGSIHWLQEREILTFDTQSERFRIIPILKSVPLNLRSKLGVFGDHLYMSIARHESGWDVRASSEIEIWFLKDNKDWNKQFVISAGNRVKYLFPISYREVILICAHNVLIFYDVETKCETLIEHRKHSSRFFSSNSQAFPFVGSLISPHPPSSNSEGKNATHRGT